MSDLEDERSWNHIGAKCRLSFVGGVSDLLSLLFPLRPTEECPSSVLGGGNCTVSIPEERDFESEGKYPFAGEGGPEGRERFTSGIFGDGRLMFEWAPGEGSEGGPIGYWVFAVNAAAAEWSDSRA